MKRVYVAGPLSPRGECNHAIKYMSNLNAMVEAQLSLARHGYAPYPTGLDYVYFLVGGDVLTEAHVKEIGLSWLAVADVVIVLEGWEDSYGTVTEVAMADALEIPVYTLERFYELEGIDEV